MKKKWKIIALVVIMAVMSYIIFVIVDCIRLTNSKVYTKPIITINETIEDNYIKYNGLGYSIKYTKLTQENMDDIKYIEDNGYNVEFKWLEISIWSWTE